MKILLIHGAHGTSTSWNWIGAHIPCERLLWGMTISTEANLIAMEKHITEPCVVVGHSMGGLYAWHLAKRNPSLVRKGISIGTPWGGSKSVSFWKIFTMPEQWVSTLSRSDKWTRQPRELETPCPWINVVTTYGFDIWGVDDNDGVITVESQRELYKPMTEITLHYGHNEILQSLELLTIIESVR